MRKSSAAPLTAREPERIMNVSQMTSEQYRELLAKQPAENKYRAVRTVVDGIAFDSRREAARYAELKLLQRAGEIQSLKVHPRFILVVEDIRGKKVLIGAYEADFQYTEPRGRGVVVEDVKVQATKTAVYRLKKKLVLALYGIEVTEI